MIFDISDIEDRLGYAFKDKMLLRKCFTHSSYANENKTDDNELLEFFGDAIIQFVVTEYLCKSVAGNEGVLTERRQQLVSKEPLQKIVFDMGLDKFLFLGSGQSKDKSKNQKLYSSLYEAICGGIYEDGGIKAVKKFILNTLIKSNKNLAKQGNEKKIDAKSKSEIQEYVEKRKMGSIGYILLNKKGPDNLPEFRSAVTLNGQVLAEGVGNSKKQAEAMAAEKALKTLKKQGGNKN